MIPSILDNDLYKFTMQQAVGELYPDVQAVYQFINRRPSDRFPGRFLAPLREAVAAMSGLRLADDQRRFLRERCPYLRPSYLEYLHRYRFDPDEVQSRIDAEGNLSIGVRGPWLRTILWEVPLLALVSELHGRYVDTSWSDAGQAEKLAAKGRTLAAGGCRFADFGTRRRRNLAAQERAVRVLRDTPGFLGTSNVHLAHVYGVEPIGTMAHEWIMAHSVLGELRHANRLALEAWYKIYQGQLGIALTDTYTTPAFFADFDARLARLYDGLRQDSGSPLEFVDRAVAHYRNLGIDPAAKTIVFSDGVTPELAVELQRYCGERIRAAFGIGTNLTNDYQRSPALSIVIKLVAIDGRPVVKLTDDPAKATGEPEALCAARRALLTVHGASEK